VAGSDPTVEDAATVNLAPCRPERLARAADDGVAASELAPAAGFQWTPHLPCALARKPTLTSGCRVVVLDRIQEVAAACLRPGSHDVLNARR
jgi:hypothetical protein